MKFLIENVLEVPIRYQLLNSIVKHGGHQNGLNVIVENMRNIFFIEKMGTPIQQNVGIVTLAIENTKL
ncbi:MULTISPECIES: hypothetical protein [Enterococcus]|uniref:Uncharacterized protein n=1 Tax=Enterococcus gallinarum TaxID=1353 RepID=A0ABD4HN19_ENTGA|nr:MULTISPECIES: hypothetical protein [Enterococcus]MBA0947975.1 hypothetical protein [Enterococcus gallinarum]MBA0961532.1 hypothetical protein [Enterococcus gallinarum]MBA0969445.1 hypothetical protein [Enterococcus gallinarum]MBA0972818.1 hypothetical protein [Enterococcus gallinarum]NVI94942.1 hypothetical protein [Enterococcus gallinarum]